MVDTEGRDRGTRTRRFAAAHRHPPIRQAGPPDARRPRRGNAAGRAPRGAGHDPLGGRVRGGERDRRAAAGSRPAPVGRHPIPMGRPEPSTGDRATARKMRALAATPVWIAGVAADTAISEEDTIVKGNSVVSTVTRGHAHEVRFYLQCEAGGLVPMRLRVETDALPALPPLPWHILDPARFAVECRLLQAAGFATAIQQAPAGSSLGTTLQVRRADGRYLTVQTGMHHPHDEPTMRD